jgi:hypothetical protein
MRCFVPQPSTARGNWSYLNFLAVTGGPRYPRYKTSTRLQPNDLFVIKNQGVDHGGHVGHQEGSGEPGRCTHKVKLQSNSELQSLTSSPT